MLKTFEDRLKVMEKEDGALTKNISQNLGTIYTSVAQYDQKSGNLKNASLALRNLLYSHGIDITSALKDAKQLDTVIAKMGAQIAGVDLKEAERLMPVLMGSNKALHSCTHCHRGQGGILIEDEKEKAPEEKGHVPGEQHVPAVKGYAASGRGPVSRRLLELLLAICGLRQALE
jgi:hypothetical protein